MASHGEMRRLLDEGRFGELFRTRLGWDNPPDDLRRVPLDDQVTLGGWDPSRTMPVAASAVAEKRGVMVWALDFGEVPRRAEQHRIARQLGRWSSDHLVVFRTDEEQLWLWPEQRPSGTGWRLVDHRYRRGKGNDALLQRLGRVRFGIRETRTLTGPQVLDRVRQSFNVEKVTKSFFKEFKKFHGLLTDRIEGIPEGRTRDRRWYASVLLNRLMFIYFIQRKGFLNDDFDYLRTSLDEVRRYVGRDEFYAYFRRFLLPLFHEGLGAPAADRAWDDPFIGRIVGRVPYVDGGIFEPHALERDYDIRIADSVFECLFDFFDQWRWHLDERPTGADNEINPDILGFIFEQYVNYTEKGRREKGAYYTKPDVTGYMCVSTIIPAVVDRLVAEGLEDPCELLPNSCDRYLHDSLGYGRNVKLPEGDLPPSEAPDEDLGVALPGERWCDVTHRRDRYDELKARVHSGKVRTIDDAVTANLDLAGLMEDYFAQMSADECEVAFEVLRSLTVCDPTCGSGAFLLATLDVLDRMYTTVFDRAEEIAARRGGGRGRLASPPQFLREAESHASDRYWLLKTICLNNLYGLDLMGEAAEIAKLRLFLKLVAQLDDVSQVEPLPDLDFNIKRGNLLVGIADADDARRRFGDELLALRGVEAAEQAARQAADAYDRYAEAQLSDTAGGGVEGKQRLNAQIGAVTAKADKSLYDMRRDQEDFDTWKETHAPFHWFAEFPSVWRKGGFDVVVGNPPYIIKKRVTDYTWHGYTTEKCPNLYAVCVERASTLLNRCGRIAMVVMHSLCFGRRFYPLREQLTRQLSTIWVSSYDRWSDSLFSGSAKVRNTILLGSMCGTSSLFTTRCHRWLASQRVYLFPTLDYFSPNPCILSVLGYKTWPFWDNFVVESWFIRLVANQDPIKSVLSKRNGFALGYRDTADDQLSVWIDPPPSFNPKNERATPKSHRYLTFKTSRERDISYLIFAGRWGYLWWLVYGDSYHVIKEVLISFPAALVDSTTRYGKELTQLAQCLSQEAGRHMTFSRRGPIRNQWRIGSYDLHRCRHITDEADWLLAQAWGLTREQYEAAGNFRDRMTFGNRG